MTDGVKQGVTILGSTGSIGQSALSVVDAHPDRLSVAGLAAGENSDLLAEQIAKYRPQIVSMASGAAIDRLRDSAPAGVAIAGNGREGLAAVATAPGVDIVLCASSGTEALEAVVAAIEHKKTIALANKEVLVMAGGIVMDAARRYGVAILPVDSEHNAIHQCLRGEKRGEVKRLILTASGGPFRESSKAEIANATRDEALDHPNWKMGDKITIDSATLMNKGFEVIEAKWLFGFDADQISVVVHPQSVVHSMVELVDGSIIAQMGVTDMKHAIQYALTYPERRGNCLAPLDLAGLSRLEFEEPNFDRFPCLGLAYDALKAGGTTPAVLNAANETAVQAFLDGQIRLSEIAEINAALMKSHENMPAADLETILRVDSDARVAAKRFLSKPASSAAITN